MTTLHLIRHARTTAEPGTVIGHTDVPLSPDGHAAACDLAHALVDYTPRPLALFSSDLRRAVDTARPIADALGLPLTTDTRLRELDFGDWEGRGWDAIHAQQPERLAAWGEQWATQGPPNGESFAALTARAADWLHAATAQSSCIVVVAHAGTIRSLLCHALGLPASAAFGFATTHVQLTTLTRTTAGRWVLESLNRPCARLD